MSISPTKPTNRIAKIGLLISGAGFLVAACSSSGGAGSAPAAAAPASSSGTATTSSIIITGGHLTNSAGRTIYLWEADTSGKPNCSGACAAVWPPVAGTAKAGAGVSAAKLTTVKRADGGTQLVYAGHPLYYFANDMSAGQTTGQGSDDFGAKWWELDATGKVLTSTGSSAKPSSSSGSGGGGYGY